MTSGLIVVTCLILSIVLVRRHLADMRQSLMDRGRAISEFVAREAELGALSGDVTALHQLATVARGHPDVAYCRFFDRDGTLLVSVGDERAPVAPDVWEFSAEIATTAVRPQREELLGVGPAGDDGAQPTARREVIGTVSIGIALKAVREQRRLAFLTAMAFTLVVALLAVASAALLLHGTFRALASAAEFAAETSRLAELKASFVTQASHEFRTPLAVILACCNGLQHYGSRMAPEQRQKRLAKIEGSVRHMTELLEDVLTLGRTESGKVPCVRQPVDLAALCQEVVADVQATATAAHRFVQGRAGCDSPVMLDPKLVRQILRNLLGNAVKYSPRGGVVRLDVTHRDGVVTVGVTDQGIGIPPEERPALFEPFHRGRNVGKIPGSGLGLAITHKAVALHGGTISVEGAAGGGTRFVVTLPCSAARAA